MLNAFIVDDEAPARKRLAKLLKPHVDDGRLDIIGEASDGIEAVEKLNEVDVDVVFLDIQMPGHDGFGVLERLDPDNRPVVIFTTAYDEYAIRAFEENAVDYLLKPIPKERLAKAIERAERLSDAPETRKSTNEQLARLLDWMDARAMEDASEPGSDDAPGEDYIEQLSVPFRDRILIVPVEQLISIEIQEGITRVFILEEDPAAPRARVKQHIVNYTLDELTGMLDPKHFMRVHRSAIIQFSHIKELVSWFSGRYKLIMSGNHEVIASRERSKKLKERMRI
ncbi:MAG: response regulator transcription factor [Rhodothermales bacterium]|nr:response regulator transcription factor [Rhodothermales bacterium]